MDSKENQKIRRMWRLHRRHGASPSAAMLRCRGAFAVPALLNPNVGTGR
ncbi:hypothetical protein BV133_249 [Blastochloris viridis]|uniref:Uncharacterized protein n=1 Tax=Blastochloris viridis TaxID=1079 RepID=A0A182CZD1_BLAVI|nr:hypothetical protein BV133_249 [Blastochloris viridis]